MRARSVFSLAILTSLTILFQAPALAQQVPGVTYEETHRVSGWEEPLCARDGNLRHYYWTDIDASSRYRTNVINRVAPSGRSYRVIKRVSDLNAKPTIINPNALTAKGRGMNDQIASSDVNGQLRKRNGGASGNRSGAGTMTYASYGFSNGGGYQSSTGSSSSAAVKGRVLSY
jgi:uncharacterized membrane protein YgcG